CWFTLQQFGRHVGGSPDPPAGLCCSLLRLDAARQAKIRYNGAEILIGVDGQYHVIAFQISMDHPMAVRFGKTSADLFGNDHRLGFPSPPPLQPPPYRLSLAALHR